MPVYDSRELNSHFRNRYDFDQAMSRLADGSQFDQYTIVRMLGRGGMGVVYEARHIKLGRSFALKVLPFEFMERRDSVQRFENEACVMANLEHDNIVRVDDLRETDGLYWFKMELATGDGKGAVSLQDLADANEGRIEQRLFLDFLDDVLKGVGYGHERGVVHRDLKPANILLFPRTRGGLRAKVADYGLVKMLGDDFLHSRVKSSVVQLPVEDSTRNDTAGTSTRALLGTWEYMAPEQQEGKPVDARSDVYSIGLMAYRMLTGQKLSMRLPSQVNEDLSLCPAWDGFIDNAIQNDPDRRYPDAKNMFKALEKIQKVVLDHCDRLDREAEERRKAQKAEADRKRKAEREAKVRQNRFESGFEEACSLEKQENIDGAYRVWKALSQEFSDDKDVIDNLSRLKAIIEKRDSELKLKEFERLQEEARQKKIEADAREADFRFRTKIHEAHQLEERGDLREAGRLLTFLSREFGDRVELQEDLKRVVGRIEEMEERHRAEEKEQLARLEQARIEREKREEAERRQERERNRQERIAQARSEANRLMKKGRLTQVRKILDELSVIDSSSDDLKKEIEEIARLQEQADYTREGTRHLLLWLAGLVVVLGIFMLSTRPQITAEPQSQNIEPAAVSGVNSVPTTEPRTSNAEPRTSNVESRTSNVESPDTQLEQINALMRRANDYFSANKLTSPAGENAVEVLQQVLSVDSGNRDALDMLDQIAAKYASWGDLKASSGDWSAARKHYESSLSVKEDAYVRSKLDQAIMQLSITATPTVTPTMTPTRTPVPASPTPTPEISTTSKGGFETRPPFLDLGNGVTLELVQIPAGSFQMGSLEKDKWRVKNESPAHLVELDGFWIGKYEVTQAQYYKVMGSNPSSFIGLNNPVEMVACREALEFCRRLSKIVGRTVTLPTEAQWEYACRAGNQSRFSFGDDETDLGMYAWFSSNAGQTHPVGKKEANAWGLFDMHGNVFELCVDCYENDYYKKSPKSNPVCIGPSWERVSRGGSWSEGYRRCRSAARHGTHFLSAASDLGFRIVCEER